MSDDLKPHGIKKMRELWDGGHAVSGLFMVPSGAYITISSDVPPELFEEIVGKITAHATGKDWRKWKSRAELEELGDEGAKPKKPKKKKAVDAAG